MCSPIHQCLQLSRYPGHQQSLFWHYNVQSKRDKDTPQQVPGHQQPHSTYCQQVWLRAGPPGGYFCRTATSWILPLGFVWKERNHRWNQSGWFKFDIFDAEAGILQGKLGHHHGCRCPGSLCLIWSIPCLLVRRQHAGMLHFKFGLLLLNEIQDMIRNVKTALIIFKTIKHVKSW